ncbi:hypothetical protein BDR04DRAFT_1198676 [Suillus decipiens]|nr:hypothetical protein BDR04DRAFT_1198676 [Suillus decipiens]
MQFPRDAQSPQRPAKKRKITSQRQYREKEGDGFQELRDAIRSVIGETPQTRRETLNKAAELLRELSKEQIISRHEPLPPLEFSSKFSNEVDEGSHTSYEPIVIPSNKTWKNAVASVRNSIPMSDTATTSSMLKHPGHPQAEIHYAVGDGDSWNFVQSTPSQFRQTSFSAQWNNLSHIHLNIDQVPYYVERVGVN